MRRNPVIALIALGLITAACGGSDGSTDTSADPLPTTTSATTTSAASTDTSGATQASTTTSAPAETTTTTEAAADPFLEAAVAAAGTYAGTWTNTTFGSTGDASMTMSVTDSGDVGMEWDLGGFVFGAGDPDSESQMINVSQLAGGTTLTTALFGDIEIAVNDDFSTLTMDAEDVPAGGIQAFRATAVWSADGSISGTYVVEFEGGGEPAEGEFELTRS